MATPISPTAMTRRGLLAATASTLLLSACGRGDQVDGDAASTASGDHELVVGVSLELTGRGAPLGVLQERALAITVESLNATGVPVGNLRRTVRLDLRDNASDPALAARQAAELARDGAHALLGGTLAETSLAMIPTAQQVRIPFVSLAYGDDIVRPLAGRTFVYKLTPETWDVATRLARLITEHRHRRVALLAAAGAHGDSGVEAFTRAARTSDLDVVRTTRLPAQGASFRAAVDNVADREPDAVVIWGNAPDAGEAAQELRLAGYRDQLYLDPAAVADETLSSRTVAAVEGAYLVHPPSLGSSTLTSPSMGARDLRDFILRYTQEYGGFNGFAPYASDALTLITEAARTGTSADHGRIRAYLGTLVHEGMVGSYGFAPSRHSGLQGAPLGVFTISNGSWIRVA